MKDKVAEQLRDYVMEHPYAPDGLRIDVPNMELKHVRDGKSTVPCVYLTKVKGAEMAEVAGRLIFDCNTVGTVNPRTVEML